jgi:hypothetical protein
VLAGAAVSVGLDAVGFVPLVWAWICWTTLLAVCVLPAVKAAADASLSLPLSVVAGVDAGFAGAVSLVSGAGAASCSATVAVAGLVDRLVASPIAAVAALAVLTGVGGLTGGATVIAAATGCGGLAAAIAAAAVAGSVVAVPLLLPLSSLLPSLDDAFAGVANATVTTWVGSVGGTLLVSVGSGLLGTFVALAAAPVGAWGPELPLVDARDGVFPPLTGGRLAAPGCGAAGAVLLIGVAAGSAFGLTDDGWEAPWPCDGALLAFLGAEFVAPVLVDPLLVDAGFAAEEFVGAGFADAGFVGAEFAGAGFDDAEFTGAGLVGAGFAGAGLAAGGGFTGVLDVSGALVASSNAANGWESACGAGGAGASACNHCDWAKDDVELTSDAILDTAKPLRSEKLTSVLATAGPARRGVETT